MSDVLGNLGDALAAALGEQFETLTVGEAEWPIDVEHCEDPEVELAEERLRGPLVWVVDWSELLAAENPPDGNFEQEGLLVILQMKVFKEADQQQGIQPAALLKALNGLIGDVARFCRPIDDPCYLSGGDHDYLCVKAQRQQARDRGDWHHMRLFYGDLLTEWRRY